MLSYKHFLQAFLCFANSFHGINSKYLQMDNLVVGSFK